MASWCSNHSFFFARQYLICDKKTQQVSAHLIFPPLRSASLHQLSCRPCLYAGVTLTWAGALPEITYSYSLACSIKKCAKKINFILSGSERYLQRLRKGNSNANPYVFISKYFTVLLHHPFQTLSYSKDVITADDRCKRFQVLESCILKVLHSKNVLSPNNKLGFP